MALSLAESQAVSEIASHLYSFLPANPHPRADQSISFGGVAARLGLQRHWQTGSKLPALTRLLAGVLEHDRDKFCPLIVEIVRTGLKYRHGKEPVTREEIEKLNALLLNVKFKIPEFHDPGFLNSLPGGAQRPTAAQGLAAEVLANLQQRLLAISPLPPQKRGLRFETFLAELFEAYKLAPRSAFRLVGEQIDGSLQFQNETYLLEARWQNERTNQADLLVFSGKVGAKAQWSRGIFISNSGFTEEGLQAFMTGKATNIICIDGLDLYHVLTGNLDLRAVIERKARIAAESNRAFVAVRELFPWLT